MRHADKTRAREEVRDEIKKISTFTDRKTTIYKKNA